jgi:hypothetical protein
MITEFKNFLDNLFGWTVAIIVIVGIFTVAVVPTIITWVTIAKTGNLWFFAWFVPSLIWLGWVEKEMGSEVW